MTAGGLPSINENQSKLTHQDENVVTGISQIDMDGMDGMDGMEMGMDDDSIMKDESRLSARVGK